MSESSMKPKRKTWRDRKHGSVGVTLDCITKSGARWTTTNDPFNDKGTGPAYVAQMIARTLSILYGADAIERGCALGIREARKHKTKEARRGGP